MFKVGDTVLYGSDGVCTINEISEKIFGNTSIEYYVLVPVFDKRSTFFVPVKNENLVGKMHHVLSGEEILEIISSSYAELEWIENDLKRGELFKGIISCGDFKKIVDLARCITNHKEEILKKGKKLHKTDETIYKEALKILYEEIALSFEVLKDDIADIVCRKISFENLIKTV